MKKTQTGEGTPAQPVHPERFLAERHVGAYLFFVFPYRDITFLAQLGSIAAVA